MRSGRACRQSTPGHRCGDVTQARPIRSSSCGFSPAWKHTRQKVVGATLITACLMVLRFLLLHPPLLARFLHSQMSYQNPSHKPFFFFLSQVSQCSFLSHATKYLCRFILNPQSTVLVSALYEIASMVSPHFFVPLALVHIQAASPFCVHGT